MPIYAYRCQECGFAKDVLQKISDAPLTECLSCGKAAFKKQVTAAGFQLKGTGWYVTDFRSGNSGASGNASGANAADANATSVNATGANAASTNGASAAGTQTSGSSAATTPTSTSGDKSSAAGN